MCKKKKILNRALSSSDLAVVVAPVAGEAEATGAQRVAPDPTRG